MCVCLCIADFVGQFLLHCTPCFAAPLSSDLPSVPSFSSSQGGATTADKGPSPELEALPTTQQGMLHAVSLHTGAPHSVPSVGGVSVHVCWAQALHTPAVPFCLNTFGVGPSALIREVVLHSISVVPLLERWPEFGCTLLVSSLCFLSGAGVFVY